MKKLGKILFLISFLSEANAGFIEVSTGEEARPGTIGTIRPDELQKEKVKESFIDPTIIGPSSSSRNETSASPGAGRRSLDSRYLETQILYSVPNVPWWESWWLSVTEWVFGAAS